jgi:SAM-dependent methyltransferase
LQREGAFVTTFASGLLSRRLALLGLVGLVGLSASALAQAPAPFEPQRGQAGKDVVWVPTPDEVVEKMLDMAKVTRKDRLVDLGSGDGKIAIAAARTYGTRATGLEYNPDMVTLSQRLAREAGVADKATFQQADIFVTDFSSATVVTMYLLPELNLRLRPQLFKMPPGTRVVSHSFTMGDWEPDETSRAGTGDLYLWRIPANASGAWVLRVPGVLPAATLYIRQRYQMVEGNADFNGLRASLVQPRLVGDRLRFALRDPSGVMQHFEGRVEGKRISGTVGRPGQAGTPFEAVRDGDAQPIAGDAPDPHEQIAARLATSKAR